MEPPIVLVTGVTGYIGSVVAAYALAAGYRVRGTVRDKSSQKAGLVKHLRGPAGGVDLAEAELTSPTGWEEAVRGVTYILHVASPVPTDMPKDAEAEVIQPAIHGVLNVMKAALHERSVKRIVLCSSVGAINEGQMSRWEEGHVFTEEDWTQLEHAGPYPVSKARAERAAWTFMTEHSPSFELCTLCPGLVIGPAATDALSSSSIVYTRLLSWSMPAIPDLAFLAVDVRDVALAHLRAMLSPAAPGQRFIVVAGGYHFRALAQDLAQEFKAVGISVPTWPLPSWIVRLAALFDGALAVVTPMLGHRCIVDASKGQRVLGMTYRECKAASLQGAYAMLVRGSLPHAKREAALLSPSPYNRVPVEGWKSYTAAPLGCSAEEAARYPFTMEELKDVMYTGGAGRR